MAYCCSRIGYHLNGLDTQPIPKFRKHFNFEIFILPCIPYIPYTFDSILKKFQTDTAHRTTVTADLTNNGIKH